MRPTYRLPRRAPFPTHHLSGATTPQAQINVPSGLNGIRETLAHMRRFVDDYKTDARIRETALSVIKNLPQKDFKGEANALLRFVQHKIRYVKDPHNAELVQTPVKTLALAQGDCDDKVTLLGALLESIGHETRFHAMGFSPGNVSHVLLECQIGNQWVALETTLPVKIGWLPPGIAHSEYKGFAMRKVTPFRRHGMGSLDTLAQFGGAVAGASGMTGGEAPASRGGAGMPGGGGSQTTTISPVFQPQVNPKIDPLILGPGATISNVDTRQSIGGPSGTGGGSTVIPPGMGPSTAFTASPVFQPSYAQAAPGMTSPTPGATPQFGPSPALAGPGGVPVWVWAVGALAIGGVLVFALSQRK